MLAPRLQEAPRRATTPINTLFDPQNPTHPLRDLLPVSLAPLSLCFWHSLKSHRSGLKRAAHQVASSLPRERTAPSSLA